MSDEKEPPQNERSFPEMPDTSDLDARMKRISANAQSIHGKQQQNREDIEKTRKTEQGDAQSLGMGLQIAYAIVGFPLLGLGAGALGDKLLGTGYLKGVIGMIGCILAVVSAMILIKQANSST